MRATKTLAVVRKRGDTNFVLQCIFRRDFLSPCATTALGIKNYPITSMSCCSDDLAQLLLKSEIQKYQSENKFFLYSFLLIQNLRAGGLTSLLPGQFSAQRAACGCGQLH